jgi:hypothetical protein
MRGNAIQGHAKIEACGRGRRLEMPAAVQEMDFV